MKTMVNKWAQPQQVKDAMVAFPANVTRLMPTEQEIPKEFTRSGNTWVDFQQQWFFKGLRGAAFTMKPGVDQKAALRHLSTIQGSFEPRHEHKEAAVAYLASLWFEKVEHDGQVYGG